MAEDSEETGFNTETEEQEMSEGSMNVVSLNEVIDLLSSGGLRAALAGGGAELRARGCTDVDCGCNNIRCGCRGTDLPNAVLSVSDFVVLRQQRLNELKRQMSEAQVSREDLDKLIQG